MGIRLKINNPQFINIPDMNISPGTVIGVDITGFINDCIND